MRVTILLVVAMTSITLRDARAAESPEDGVKAFFSVYGTFHPSDGIPDAKARARYAPTISPRLEGLLARADEVEIKFANVHKDSPPLVEGDLMTSNFEGATSFEVGDCRTTGLLATCRVNLVYDRGTPGEKPARWTDSLVLVASQRGWAVDDVVYGATWTFGNKGRLSETLKRAIADAGS